MKPSSRILALSLLVTSLTPTHAFAASPTPQQMLNQALQSAFSYTPLRMDGEMDINISTKTLIKGEEEGVIKMHATLMERTLSREKHKEELEGRFTVDRASIQSTGEDPMSLNEPLALQWKQVGAKTYVRIEHAPLELTEMLKKLVDPSLIVGQWISMGTQESSQNVLSELPITPPITPPKIDTEKLKDLAMLTSVPIFRVVGVEKREKGANGHELIRLKARLNPLVINKLHTMTLKAVSAKDPERRKKTREINTQFAEIRSLVSRLHIAANIDATAKTLKRLEIGGTTTRPKKTCSIHERTKKETCRTTAQMTIRYAAGISLTHDTDTAVSPPVGALTLQELMEKIKAASEATPVTP